MQMPPLPPWSVVASVPGITPHSARRPYLRVPARVCVDTGVRAHAHTQTNGGIDSPRVHATCVRGMAHCRYSADSAISRNLGYQPNFYDYRIAKLSCSGCYDYDYRGISA